MHAGKTPAQSVTVQICLVAGGPWWHGIHGNLEEQAATGQGAYTGSVLSGVWSEAMVANFSSEAAGRHSSRQWNCSLRSGLLGVSVTIAAQPPIIGCVFVGIGARDAAVDLVLKMADATHSWVQQPFQTS